MALFDMFRRNKDDTASDTPVIANPDENGAVDAFAVLSNPIGKEQVQKATLELQKYKSGKANLERRIIDDEQWYKLRHWECMRQTHHDMVEPYSGWLFNCVVSKHADAMDNFPSPNVLPREEGDKGEAKMLSSIIPVILDQTGFEEVYDACWYDKLIAGTGVYGVFWDSSKLNGLGDIAVKQIDLLSLFWAPGITDIQSSPNVFHVELQDNEKLIAQYPQLNGKLGSSSLDVSHYIYDDSVDTSDKSAVIDWYYKKSYNGREVLHYCKYVNDEVLYASENDPAYIDRGFYDHGKYPFVFDPLFKTKGTPAGFGYVDVGKSAQEYIDRGNQAMMQNMLINARQRYFVRDDGEINEKEFADMTSPIVHFSGNMSGDSVIPIQGSSLGQVYVQLLQSKIEEMKETTGNRDVSTGGSSGATAASAIAAMQEAGSKLSRDANKAAYRAFKEVVLLCIELIRQFYDLPRSFRILGEAGAEQYLMYSNEGIQPQSQGMDFGVDMGMRLPVFDVDVTAQKQSPYSKMAQNELALQFFGQGFFNPQISDQALACLDMMDFDRKDFVMQKIQQNGTMFQQIQQLQQQMMALGAMVDQMRGTTEVEESLAQQFGGEQMSFAGGGEAPEMSAQSQESPVTAKARQRVADATAPQ